MREKELNQIKEQYPKGTEIRIIKMFDEPQYDNKVGTVEFVDDVGQLHGTWGGCALIPSIDQFEKI